MSKLYKTIKSFEREKPTVGRLLDLCEQHGLYKENTRFKVEFKYKDDPDNPYVSSGYAVTLEEDITYA